MSQWLFFTLATMVLWGVWGTISKPASNYLTAWEIQALSNIGILPVIIHLYLRSRMQIGSLYQRGGWLAFASGVIGSIGNIACYQVLAMGGKAASVIPFTSLYPVVTILLALILLKERLSKIQWSGLLITIVALWGLSGGDQGDLLNPWMLLALIPILLWGTSAYLQKLATNNFSSEIATLAFLIGFLPSGVLVPLFYPVHWQQTGPIWLLVIALGLFYALGNLTVMLAYSHGGCAAIVTPMASLYSLITIPLAILCLHEEVSIREIVGIIFAVFAIITLCWENSKSKDLA